MTRRLALLAAVMLVLGARGAWAHDGHSHKITGTVTALNGNDLQVKTTAGKTVSIAINDKTTVTRQKKTVELAEVQVGRRVVVDVGNGKTPLIAKAIEIGAAAKAAAKTTAKK